jgi:hypothetical protein
MNTRVGIPVCGSYVASTVKASRSSASWIRSNRMYDNDQLFGVGKVECRSKQESFISAATSIAGLITCCSFDEKQELCAFRNESTFVDAAGGSRKIDGLHVQRWKNGATIEERCYRGDMMAEKISEGIGSRAGHIAAVSGLCRCGVVGQLGFQNQASLVWMPSGPSQWTPPKVAMRSPAHTDPRPSTNLGACPSSPDVASSSGGLNHVSELRSRIQWR